MQFEVLFALLSAFSVVQSATWNLKEKISGDDYNDKFDYMTDKDPTGGLVVYQSEQAAKDMNLTRVDNDNFVMRVDTTKTQTEGRPSVRLESKDHYEDSVLMYVFPLTLACNSLMSQQAAPSGQHFGLQQSTMTSGLKVAKSIFWRM